MTAGLLSFAACSWSDRQAQLAGREVMVAMNKEGDSNEADGGAGDGVEGSFGDEEVQRC